MSDASKRLMRRIFINLDGDRLVAFLVFLRESSIGDLLAYKLLKERGIENPWSVVYQLIDDGWLERGVGCISLSKEIREILAREGVGVLSAGRSLAVKIERQKRPAIRVP